MKFPESYRATNAGPWSSSLGDEFGFFCIPSQKLKDNRTTRRLKVMASAGDGDSMPWEHVSVSLPDMPDRCPSWEEMCFVRDLFWEPEACVMQLHPPQSDYVNTHNGCLHLWRPINVEIPRPPQIAV